MAKHDGVLLTVAIPESQMASLCYTFLAVKLPRYEEEWHEGEKVLELSADGDLIRISELKDLFKDVVLAPDVDE